VADSERFVVELNSSDGGDQDAVFIRLEDKLRTLEEAQAVCEAFGVRARLMRGDVLHGWVEIDGRFSLGGTQLDPPAKESA
jgi:hypothetical protein